MKIDVSILQYSWKWWVAIGIQLSHARSVSDICSLLLRYIVLVVRLVKFLHEVCCLNARGFFFWWGNSEGDLELDSRACLLARLYQIIFLFLYVFKCNFPLWRQSACCRMRSFRLGCAHYSFLLLHFLWLQETSTFLVWLFIRPTRSLCTLQKKLKYKILRLWIRVGLRDGFL